MMENKRLHMVQKFHLKLLLEFGHKNLQFQKYYNAAYKCFSLEQFQ